MKFTKNKERSIKRKIDQRQPLKNRGEFMCSGRVNRCCSISGTRSVTHCYKEVQIMNKERAWLQTEHIRGHLWHRYSVMVNQVMVATLKLMTKLTTVNPWFSSFPVSSNPLWYIQLKLLCRIEYTILLWYEIQNILSNCK
jgi:hypothetical protein